ncbi:hypothetical protein Y032_0106g3748 [Ancylostoma ceylanicum]|uniref:Uncharacterized protein n=1 Tax=Ancylostoma ceylanicum TaxID=53326 RepID=A0A016TFU2_9BILA|nr:hypothetical protein Y032_0106g3748 [Ancylostoma ceylanicum]
MTVTVHIIPKQQDDKLIRSVRSPFSVWDFDNSITLNMSTGPKLFNPYHYFGTPYMWARGFPVSRLQNHTNEHDELCLCHKMRSAAVQQGLVQKHLDVDVIFRLLHADKKNEEKFNEIAPPIVLQAGTYSPFNSRNTLFHRTAFFTLFLPITVTFEFPGDLYRKVDAMLEFLDGWECEHDEIAGCVVSLAEEFRERNFWGSADVEAIIQWISDLKKIGYQFPQRVDRDPYDISKNGTIRGQNCRRVSLKFGAFSKNSMTEKLLRKLNALGDIADWCAEANYTDLLQKKPSPSQLATLHTNNNVLRNLSDSVLIVTSNYPWNYTIGLIQRMYQPYFGLTIFCGTWFPDKYNDEHFPSIIRPFNYINLTEEEMQVGYYAYYCLAKVKEMKLGRVKGYFVMADDTTFNFWNGVNPELVMHPSGDTFHHSGVWWNRPSGFTAAVKTLELFEQTYKDDPSVQAIWRQYKKGLRKKNERRNASHVLIDRDGWSVADLYYIPSSGLDYFAGLMEIFFEAGLFHEIAFTKYLHSVPYESARFDYLNGTGGRGAWHERYNADLMMMHPIKLSFFGNLTERRRLCDSVLKTFSDKLLTTTTSDSNENSTE